MCFEIWWVRIGSKPVKPFSMMSWAHLSRSLLPSFASIAVCSQMHRLTLVGLSDINVPNPANYVGQRMAMTRNGSNHLHTRIRRFWAGWILADIKYTACPIQQICSVRSLERRRWRDSWLELSMSQKRLGNLKTWWMCALCTRSLGRRGLLSGNFSSKYCKAFPPTFSIRQHHKVTSSEGNWLLHK